MKSKLLALFSGSWANFLNDLEEFSGEENAKKKSVYRILGNQWEEILKPIPDMETALFQTGLIGIKDEFPAHYRRFIQVGQSSSERLHNLFELAFEKGYNQVIFVEEYAANTSTESIQEIWNLLQKNDMVFGPNQDGSIYLWGMNKKHFWAWQNFSFQAPESIVEQLSLCHESNVTYKVIPSFDRAEAERKFKNAL
jgi:hypothetical protein